MRLFVHRGGKAPLQRTGLPRLQAPEPSDVLLGSTTPTLEALIRANEVIWR